MSPGKEADDDRGHHEDEPEQQPAGRRPGQEGKARVSHRAAAAALGVITAETLAGATPAQAAQGSPVLLGQNNTGATAATGLVNTRNQSAVLADPSTLTGNGGL